MIDVVIPAHPKDFGLLRHCIRGVLRYVAPVRRVFVVSPEPYSFRDDRVEWMAEAEAERAGLPSVRQIDSDRVSRSPDATPRAAWIYQQLLCLGAGSYIDELSKRFLVVDADVVFLRPVSFAEEGRIPYSRATEYNPPYLEAYRRLTGEEPPSRESFTAHHMLYDQELLREMFAAIEERRGEPWCWAYVHAADPAEFSAINEQDTFGLWMLGHHPELLQHRQLYWRDVSITPTVLGRAQLGLDYDFVAVHAYRRGSRRTRAWHLALRLGREVFPARR